MESLSKLIDIFYTIMGGVSKIITRIKYKEREKEDAKETAEVEDLLDK